MDNFSKYLGLIFLIIGVFFGFILSIALIILLLRFLSIGLFENRISEGIFHYFIIIIPYLIFFGAYYYLRQKVMAATNKTSRGIAALFLIIGCLICVSSFILSTLVFLNIKNDFVEFFSENSGYNLVMQLVIVFLTAATLGFGDPKEKDWMEKSQHNNV
jgi:hypothetical protein